MLFELSKDTIEYIESHIDETMALLKEICLIPASGRL